MGNFSGRLFRVGTWGESHGGAVGVVVDGCPPCIALSVSDIQLELDRRRPGQSKLTTQRKEADEAQILSGVFEGQTLGTSILIAVRNKDARSQDYEKMRDLYRPSHADFTYDAKYGIRNWQGGGRASARETIGRVAAGAIAKKVLHAEWGVDVCAYVKQVGLIDASLDPLSVSHSDVEKSIARCPDEQASIEMVELIDEVRRAGDSVGGVVECVARSVPAGWGMPVFDKLEADLAKAMMSIPAAKGFEVGSGFAGTRMRGSEHNDLFMSDEAGLVGTVTNRSGGIQGGISNGEPIVTRVAFKPTATIAKEQATINREGGQTSIKAKGRHDPCVLPRAVPIVEAMMALTLVDHALLQRGQCGQRSR